MHGRVGQLGRQTDGWMLRWIDQWIDGETDIDGSTTDGQKTLDRWTGLVGWVDGRTYFVSPFSVRGACDCTRAVLRTSLSLFMRKGCSRQNYTRVFSEECSGTWKFLSIHALNATFVWSVLHIHGVFFVRKLIHQWTYQIQVYCVPSVHRTMNRFVEICFHWMTFKSHFNLTKPAAVL